jgi:HSP20 family protein
MFAYAKPQKYARHGFAAFASNRPEVNIKETDGGFELEVAAPGLSKEDFKLEIEGQILSISANKQVTNEDEQLVYKRREFSYASFRRSFELPKNIDADGISAAYEQGILRVHLPKHVPVKPEAKQIVVL